MEGLGRANKPNTRTTTFEFVNYEPSNGLTNRKLQTQVRSHVTRWQHRQARARARETHFGAISTQKPGKEGSSNTSNSSSASSTPPTSLNAQHDRAERPPVAPQRQNDDTEDVEAMLYTPEAYKLARSSPIDAFSRGEMSFRVIALQDSDNVVGSSLRDLHLNISTIMSLYENICRIQATNYDRVYAIKAKPKAPGVRFYSFVYTEPLLLCTAVLLGVRNLLDVLGRPLSGTTKTNVIQLERFLVRSVSDALQDPVRGVSDQVLITVALCAAYEIKHGTGACYHVHMRGLVQMVKLRGGLGVIADPDPYVARVLIWIDSNTAKLAGCQPYLAGMYGGIAARPDPDEKVFRAKGVRGH